MWQSRIAKLSLSVHSDNLMGNALTDNPSLFDNINDNNQPDQADTVWIETP
ncbi:MAG: hypothetical protein AB8B97_25020 [Granulosicoccus sp.]